jgi:hypothetical protein
MLLEDVLTLSSDRDGLALIPCVIAAGRQLMLSFF